MQKILVVMLMTLGYYGSDTLEFSSVYLLLPRSSRDTESQADQNGSSGSQSTCRSPTACVPISSCPLIEDLLDQSCFTSDRYFHRLNALTCGHANNEDYVCCPPGGYDGLAKPGEGQQNRECGESMVKSMDYEGIGAQPWVARVGFTNTDTGSMRFACSGSIISKKAILTAAHCALAKPEGYKLSTVVVGEWDTERTPDCNQFFCANPAQVIKVDQVLVHPGYESSVFRHDIALIILREEIKYSITASPICLNESPEDLTNLRATLVGWGKLAGQNNQIGRQQMLEVPLLPLSACQDIFGSEVQILEGQLCAGGEEGKDACSGFGGAPLLLKKGGRYVQVGIVSFGSENCGSAGVPSVYTNVATYHQWIMENIPS